MHMDGEAREGETDRETDRQEKEREHSMASNHRAVVLKERKIKNTHCENGHRMSTYITF